MKVAFNNSLDDIVALYEALVLKQRETGQARKPYKNILIFAGWGALFTGGFWLLMKEPPYLLIGVFLVIILFMALRSKSGLRSRLRTSLAMSHPDGEWRANVTEINDAGITHISQDNVTAFWWGQVSEIVREEDYLRFYTHLSSVSQVPLRVFRTPEELDRFEAEARRLWQAHKNDPPISFPEVSGIIEDDSPMPSCVLINPSQPVPH